MIYSLNIFILPKSICYCCLFLSLVHCDFVDICIQQSCVCNLFAGKGGTVDDQVGSRRERRCRVTAASMEHAIQRGDHGTQSERPVGTHLLPVPHASETRHHRYTHVLRDKP